MRIDLDEEEFQLLIFALGIATGFVNQDPKGSRTGNRLLELTNKVNANNPKYKVGHGT